MACKLWSSYLSLPSAWIVSMCSSQWDWRLFLLSPHSFLCDSEEWVNQKGHNCCGGSCGQSVFTRRKQYFPGFALRGRWWDCRKLFSFHCRGIYEYELTLRTDLYTDKHTQWFYFRVQNTRKDVTYRFTIVNLLKPKSLYAVGMKPLLYSQLDAATYNVGWRREGQEIKYYKNNSDDGQQPLYCLTWTIQFPHDQDTCFFAHFYPYTYTDLQCYLLSITNNPIQSQFCKLRALCRSLAGNTVYLLTITNPSRTPQEAAAKKAVVLSARVHPGESNGSWIMRGFLDFILSNSPDAQLLRDIFVFKVIPMLNPDGVIVGNYRCSLAGRDLNRHYKTVLKDSFPCIWYTKNMVKRWDLFVDNSVNAVSLNTSYSYLWGGWSCLLF